MVEGGYCFNTCDRCFCVGECICMDIPPNGEYSCAEQKEFGQCAQQWMIDGKYCQFTCGRCDCLLQPSSACIQYTLDVHNNTSTMLDIVSKSPVVTELLEELAASPATFLVPSNKAWEKFRKSIPNAEALFNNQKLLAEFIAFHVLSEVVPTGKETGVFKSMNLNERVTVEENSVEGGLVVSDQNGRKAKGVDTSSGACGSQIHVIDNVLIPSTTSLPFQCLKFMLGSRAETTQMLEMIESYPRLKQLFQDASAEPHTYFIPSNQAWETFKKDQRNSQVLFNNEDLLAEFVAYHLVEKRSMFANFEDAAVSLHMGEPVMIKAKPSRVVDFNGNEAKIIMDDIQACGSVINVIDRVLIPSTSQYPEECLMYTLGSRQDTSTMLDIVKQTQLSDLFTMQDRTYFIPSNSAWHEFKTGLLNASELFDNSDLLSEFILYHVLQEATTLAELEKSATPSMQLGETVRVVDQDRVIDNNNQEALVLQGDIKACGSVIHVIDRVLMPTTTLHPYDCLTFALGSQRDTSTFLQMVKGSNILQAVLRITSMMPHTYLVPNQDAFVKLFSSMEDPSILTEHDQLLAEIISYHMIAGSRSSTGLLLARNVTTKLLGEKAQVINGDGPELVVMDKNGRDSTIVRPDFHACNSTIHVVDEVLVPSTTKSPLECLHFAFETLPGTQAFSSLIKQSAAAQGLLERLARDEPHTFLVPSNQAVDEFMALLKSPQVLLKNDQVLEDLIEYHVIKGAMTTEDLYASGDIGTLLFEEPIEFDMSKSVDVESRGPTDKDAVILMPNIQICNTTMHIIDHMLFPAITSVQGLLNSEDGVFRSFVLIPETPLISFKNVENFVNDVLGEERVIEAQEEKQMNVASMIAPQIEGKESKYGP
eukprot:TRINITY_DN1311_c0_g1_i4.p1 TRINITY_DN1311_c0_g1~~TRINITY_DN1311_c0_g1_i4.p1  ORF type:complete len:877 (-),score=156.34 TRINITY_DN1311_c0_g1_i4:515-3145(-)